MRYFAPIIAIIILAIIIIILADGVLENINPGIRAARAAEALAQAQQAQARADAARAWSLAKQAQAPALAQLLTLTLSSLAAIGVILAGGIAYALILAAAMRARLIHPDRHTGLYPAIPDGRIYQVINETGAQVLAAAAARAPLRAPTAGRILTTLLSPPQSIPSTPSTPVEPDEIILPDSASIYDAPRSPRPALPIGQGAGGPVLLPLKNLGNVLIAGLPGSGKSNLLASILWSMGAWANSRCVQVAMIDTKRVDFGRLPADLRVMWRPVAVDMHDGRALIDDALAECNRRFDAIGAGGDTPPYLVVIVDELADWTGDRMFSDAALEIGRKGRAAGVSLILATQMARADSIDPRLRAIAGASIAMRLRSAADSRMVIGEAGAELLPVDRPGRCLVARGHVTPAQAFFAGLDAGDPDCEFYRRLSLLPRSASFVPVPTGNGNGNGPQTAHPAQEQEQEPRWTAFLAAALADGHPRSPTHLARLMAAHDGRPDDYPAYKSIAWRYLNEP